MGLQLRKFLSYSAKEEIQEMYLAFRDAYSCNLARSKRVETRKNKQNILSAEFLLHLPFG